MVNIGKRLTAQWKDAVNLVLGLWLVISPWALNFMLVEAPTWNAFVVGVVIAVAAAAALIAFNQWEEWVEAALGAWLIVSPFLLGFSMEFYATWNQIIVGALVGALAVWSAMEPTTAHRAM